MGWAFDKAIRGLSEESKADPNIHRNLARCILRLFDEGERARLDLSIIALSIVANSGRRSASKEGIALFYPIGVLFPSDTDGRPLAA